MGVLNTTDYKSYGKSFEEMDEQELVHPKENETTDAPEGEVKTEE